MIIQNEHNKPILITKVRGAEHETQKENSFCMQRQKDARFFYFIADTAADKEAWVGAIGRQMVSFLFYNIYFFIFIIFLYYCLYYYYCLCCFVCLFVCLCCLVFVLILIIYRIGACHTLLRQIWFYNLICK